MHPDPLYRTDHRALCQSLIVVNGPDAYGSPRWCDKRDSMPTWDGVALEPEGRVPRRDDEGLEQAGFAMLAQRVRALAA